MHIYKLQSRVMWINWVREEGIRYALAAQDNCRTEDFKTER
jgi:hypothetical protein